VPFAEVKNKIPLIKNAPNRKLSIFDFIVFNLIFKTANIEQKLKILNLSDIYLSLGTNFCYLVDFTKNKHIVTSGVKNEIIIDSCNEISKLDQFTSLKDHKFGYLSYDLKNCFEKLHSQNEDYTKFNLAHFFIPHSIIEINNTKKRVVKGEFINVNFLDHEYTDNLLNFTPHAKLNEKEYLEKIRVIKNHISRGDIYETNFCYEFYQTDIDIDPFQLFVELSRNTEASFAAFCKFGDKFIISASPERFIKKEGEKLISQPIKGTRKAVINQEENKRLINELKTDQKERSENIMIVDLVRNDLSRIAKTNSVKVDALCDIHSFKNVHQMVSTISCDVDENISFIDVLKATFPMGSMTGAPKISAMQLMEKYETSKRGVYSGSVGYITPENNFDFNVIIRTFLYNSSNKYLSFMVGGAIIDQCVAENEYKETLLKANALLKALNKE